MLCMVKEKTRCVLLVQLQLRYHFVLLSECYACLERLFLRGLVLYFVGFTLSRVMSVSSFLRFFTAFLVVAMSLCGRVLDFFEKIT